MPFNIKTLSHIALIDLEGRHGLQGHHLYELLNYLRRYLQTHAPIDENLINILDELIKNSEKISELNSHPNDEKLLRLAQTFQKKIENLHEEETFYLPGGWINQDMNSHGLIFSFTKTKNNQLIFKIYNGGAGLELHDEIASIDVVRYMPVKIYQFDFENATHPHFIELLKKLIEPQIPHAPWRKNKFFSYNQNKFYDLIHLHCHLLKGKLLDARAIMDTRLASSGITSGTCSQASIQQFLKIYFNDIHAFKRFMALYKMYTIKDYLHENHNPNPTIAKLINKALMNIQRIIEEPNLFDETEYEELSEHLKSLVITPKLEEALDDKEKIISLPRTPRILKSAFQPNLPMQSDAPSLPAKLEKGRKEKDCLKALKALDDRLNNTDAFLISGKGKLATNQFKNDILNQFFEIPFFSVHLHQELDSSFLNHYSPQELLLMIEKIVSISHKFRSCFIATEIAKIQRVLDLSMLTLLDLMTKKYGIQQDTIQMFMKHLQALDKNNPELTSIDHRVNQRFYTLEKIYSAKLIEKSIEKILAQYEEHPNEMRDLLDDFKERLQGEIPYSAWQLPMILEDLKILAHFRQKLKENETANIIFKNFFYKKQGTKIDVFVEKFELEALITLINDIIPSITTTPLDKHSPTANPLSNPSNDKDKRTIEELYEDLRIKEKETSQGLFASKPIIELKEAFSCHFIIVQTILNIPRDVNFPAFKLSPLKDSDDPFIAPRIKKLNEIFGYNNRFDRLKWIRKNLFDPEVQKIPELYVYFIQAYLFSTTQKDINDTTPFKIDDLIKPVNDFLRKYEIYYQNIIKLNKLNLLDIIQDILLHENISRTLGNYLHQEENSQPMLLNIDQNQILRYLSSQYQDPTKVYGRLPLSANIKHNDFLKRTLTIKGQYFIPNARLHSNEIECSPSTGTIKILKYIHLNDELMHLIFMDYLSNHPSLLHLLFNEEEFQDYVLFSLFNSYALSSTLKNHPQKLMQAIQILSNNVFEMSGKTWNDKNAFVLRLKCYLICYAYAQDRQKFADNFLALKQELSLLPETNNRLYCDFYMLSTQMISGEPIDWHRYDAINRQLIEHQFTKRLMDFEIELYNEHMNLIDDFVSIHDLHSIMHICFKPSDETLFKLSQKLPNELIQILDLSKSTQLIQKNEHWFETLSTPVYQIELENGKVKTIQKNGKRMLNLDMFEHLPVILTEQKIVIWQDIHQTEHIVLERNNSILSQSPGNIVICESKDVGWKTRCVITSVVASHFS